MNRVFVFKTRPVKINVEDRIARCQQDPAYADHRRELLDIWGLVRSPRDGMVVDFIEQAEPLTVLFALCGETVEVVVFPHEFRFCHTWAFQPEEPFEMPVGGSLLPLLSFLVRLPGLPAKYLAGMLEDGSALRTHACLETDHLWALECYRRETGGVSQEPVGGRPVSGSSLKGNVKEATQREGAQ